MFEEEWSYSAFQSLPLLRFSELIDNEYVYPESKREGLPDGLLLFRCRSNLYR